MEKRIYIVLYIIPRVRARIEPKGAFYAYGKERQEIAPKAKKDFPEEKNACKRKEYLLDFFGKGAGHPCAGGKAAGRTANISDVFKNNPNPEKCFLKGGTITMAEKVLKIGVEREDGFLYYIDKDGDVARVQMARGGKKGGKPKKVEKTGIKKEKGYLYFLDKKGDISRAKMVNAK